MNIDNPGNIVFILIFIAVIGSFLFKTIKYGGFKAALFGAPIESTLGEVRGGSVKFVSVVMKVHKLGGHSSENAIGLEIVSKTFASYQMKPVTLSISETKKLITLLESSVANHKNI